MSSRGLALRAGLPIALIVIALLVLRACSVDEDDSSEPKNTASAERPQSTATAPRSRPPAAGDATAIAGQADPAETAPDVVPSVGHAFEVHVLDSSAVPVVDAVVTVCDGFALTMMGREWRVAEARTGADGSVVIRLPAEPEACGNLVHVEHRGESAILGNLPTRSRDPHRVDLRLGPSARVRGVVRLRDGSPVHGPEVRADFEVTGWTYRTVATTGPDGRFEFVGLPRAQYQRRADIRVSPRPGSWGGAAQPTLAEAEAGDIVIEVDPTTRLRGRFLDSSGAPARAYATFVGERWSTTSRMTAADGRFDFEVPRGNGHVEVESERRFAARRIENVRATEPELDLGDIVLERQPPK